MSEDKVKSFRSELDRPGGRVRADSLTGAEKDRAARIAAEAFQGQVTFGDARDTGVRVVMAEREGKL